MLCVTNMRLHGTQDPEFRPPRQHPVPPCSTEGAPNFSPGQRPGDPYHDQAPKVRLISAQANGLGKMPR